MTTWESILSKTVPFLPHKAGTTICWIRFRWKYNRPCRLIHGGSPRSVKHLNGHTLIESFRLLILGAN